MGTLKPNDCIECGEDTSFIQCERCGSHGETKEEILKGFKHYKDVGLCSRKFLDYDILCNDCLKENEDA
jgi:hypothetical protein